MKKISQVYLRKIGNKILVNGIVIDFCSTEGRTLTRHTFEVDSDFTSGTIMEVAKKLNLDLLKDDFILFVRDKNSGIEHLDLAKACYAIKGVWYEFFPDDFTKDSFSYKNIKDLIESVNEYIDSCSNK